MSICKFFFTYINDLQTLKFFIVFNQEWITLLCEDSCTKVFPNKLLRNISQNAQRNTFARVPVPVEVQAQTKPDTF